MPTNPNMVAIQTVTVGAGGASTIEFTNIPQTYTDLVLQISARNTASGAALRLRFNGSTTGYSDRYLEGDGSAVSSGTSPFPGYAFVGGVTPSSATASTFASNFIYIPNYTSSNNKSISSDGVTENNATTAYADLSASLWSNSAAITSIELTPNANTFAQYSTATLYGVTSAGYGAKATGGIITQDENYFYHTFLSSGTFTPTSNITCDVLAVAGGGGGRNYGGGGAGQVLESLAKSFTSSTAYTVTVGAGGSALANGNDTTITGSGFTTITSSKGLVGTSETGANSGGTSGNGNAGGTGYAAPNPWHGGGGGGASAVGANATSTTAGNGGAGLASSLSGSSITYGGGGGGGCEGSLGSSTRGTGGSGGGGNGSGRSGSPVGSAGTANLGGGGGGGDGNNTTNGFAGGSGIVIVRYAK